MKRNIGKYALWVTLFLIAVVVFCLSLIWLSLACMKRKGCNFMFYWIAIEIIFLIRIVGQIIQLLNKENNYGLIIIRISNVLGILLIALAFIQNPIHEMNRVKDKYWNYYPIYLVTVFIDLILEVLLRRRLYKKEEQL